MRVRRTILSVATGAMVLVTGMAVTAGVAEAVPAGTTVAPAASTEAVAPAPRPPDRRGLEFSRDRVRLRSGPHERDRVVGVGRRGDRIEALGSTRGDRVRCEGRRHSSDRWVKVRVRDRDRRTGVVGWASECYVDYRR